MVFVGASAILVGIVVFGLLVFREPHIPMVNGDGEEFSLSIEIAKAGTGCSSDLMSGQCVEFWSSRGVPRRTCGSFVTSRTDAPR